VKSLNYFLALLAISGLLSGCPPSLYCRVVNHTHRIIKIDFEYNGSGTLLPHFELAPRASRRVMAGPLLVAHDLDGHFIGRLDVSRLKQHSQYYSYQTQTFNIVVEDNGIFPLPISRSENGP